MPEKSYPQIPTTVWWGIRALLLRSPKAKFDENMLSASLDVQVSAARAYLKQLALVGILDSDGKITELGGKWRLDDTYTEAVGEILKSVYDEGLTTICPPGEVDRSKAKSWFMSQGLGAGSAGNKAATYELIASVKPGPHEPEADRAPRGAKAVPKQKNAAKSVSNNGERRIEDKEAPKKTLDRKGGADAFPLNVNVQIHISADASSDQIDSIFKSMRHHLYED
jgi:hypothetical protein